MVEHPNEEPQNLDDDPTATEDLDVTEETSAEVRGGGDIHITKPVDQSTPKLYQGGAH